MTDEKEEDLNAVFKGTQSVNDVTVEPFGGKDKKFFFEELYNDEKKKHEETSQKLRSLEETCRRLELAINREQLSDAQRIRTLEQEIDRINRTLRELSKRTSGLGMMR